MAKKWDSLMKRLMQASPQDLVSWIFPDGLYEGELNTELQKDPVIADLMYTVRWKGQQVALHIEFQTRHHEQMDRRVWEYNVLTCVRTGLPVYSVVIYLLKNNSVVEPPYTVQLPTGEIIHHFVFRNIKLWEIPPKVLLQRNLPGLWPLLPLTQGGKRREVVEQMMRSLQRIGRKELLGLGYALSTLVFEQESDLQWLKEISMSLEDVFEDTWLYKEWVQKGVNRGLQQGLQEGVQQGLQEGLLSVRTTLVRFIETHFPDQLSLAKQQVELMTTLSQVQETLDKLFVARTDDDVRKILLDIPHA